MRELNLRGGRLLWAAALACLTSLACRAPHTSGDHGGADHHGVPEHAIHYLEIVTPDPAAVRDLYAALYGWDFAPADPLLGQAFVAAMPGGSLCGIRAPMGDQELPVVRTYLRVPDLRAAIRAAADRGAVVAIESMSLGGHGEIAMYLLDGVEQGLWQVP